MCIYLFIQTDIASVILPNTIRNCKRIIERYGRWNPETYSRMLSAACFSELKRHFASYVADEMLTECRSWLEFFADVNRISKSGKEGSKEPPRCVKIRLTRV